MKIKHLLIILFLIITGESYSDNNNANTARPPITPFWALGHIIWEDSLNTQAGTLELVNLYMEHDIAVDGVIIDSPWSTAYNDFNWDPNRFPNSNNMLDELKLKGVKPILWTTGTVNLTGKDVPIQKCETYDYVKEMGYGINNSEPTRWWKGEGIHIDFTNLEASNWWKTQLNKVSNKIYGYKVDQAEAYFGDSVMTSIGKMPNKEFRKYYYDFMYDYAQESKPGEGIVLARPYSYQATETSASIQKMSLGWCGDFQGNYEGLIKQLKDIYQSSILGYGAVGCEIGGFSGAQATDSQFVRYCQFASMTASMINGGSNGPFSSHLPWQHNEVVNDIYKLYVSLHHELRPYIFSTLVDCHFEGGGLIKNCDKDKIYHFLGNDIFCKPIVSDDLHVEFTIPGNDEWIDFWDKTNTVKGGDLVTQDYSLREMPLFIKKGAVIPLQIKSELTGLGDSSMDGRVVLVITPKGKINKVIHYPTSEGLDYDNITIKVDQPANAIDIESDNPHDYSLIIWDENNCIIRKEVTGINCHVDYSMTNNVCGPTMSQRKNYYTLGGVLRTKDVGRGVYIEENIDKTGRRTFQKIVK